MNISHVVIALILRADIMEKLTLLIIWTICAEPPPFHRNPLGRKRRAGTFDMSFVHLAFSNMIQDIHKAVSQPNNETVYLNKIFKILNKIDSLTLSIQCLLTSPSPTVVLTELYRTQSNLKKKKIPNTIRLQQKGGGVRVCAFATWKAWDLTVRPLSLYACALVIKEQEKGWYDPCTRSKVFTQAGSPTTKFKSQSWEQLGSVLPSVTGHVKCLISNS
jgi:hypothetical protein